MDTQVKRVRRTKEEIAKERAEKQRIREERLLQRKRKAAEKEQRRLAREAKKESLQRKRLLAAERRRYRESKKTDLFPTLAYNQMMKFLSTRKNIIPKINYSLGRDEVSFLLVNPENPMQCLLRYSDNTWRNGLWFFDFKTKAQLKFDPSIHKLGYGNDKIQWQYIAELSKSKETVNE